MKKLFTAVLLCGVLAGGLAAQNLNDFKTDFESLFASITHDIAPNLQLSSLAGNPVGDATIDNFMLFLPGAGITVSDGLAKQLKDPSHQWAFALPLPSIIEAAAGDSPEIGAIEGKFFPYPALKLGVGFGLGGGFDIIASGFFWPQGLTDAIAASDDKLAKVGLKLESFNFGLELRKTFLQDTGGFIPALSLGLLYNVSGMNLSMDNVSISALSGSALDLGGGTTFDFSGKIGISTIVHNFGFDLHVSKHIFKPEGSNYSGITPYLKLSGVYQYALSKGNAQINAHIDNGGSNIATIDIDTNPQTEINDFAGLATIGLDIDCFIFILNTNMVFDLGRASLNISDLSLTGISGKGVAWNVGLRWQF